MSGTVLISCGIGEWRLVTLEDGRPVSCHLLRDALTWGEGAIGLGRVAKIIIETDTAIIDLGGGVSAALKAKHAPRTHMNRGPIRDRVREGEMFPVQILREARSSGKETKSATVTAIPKLVGRFVTLDTRRPGVGIPKTVAGKPGVSDLSQRIAPHAKTAGLILRQLSTGVDPQVVEQEAQTLADSWTALLESQARMTKPGLLLAAGDAAARIRTEIAEDVDRIIVDDGASRRRLRKALVDLPELSSRIEAHGQDGDLFEDYEVEAEIEAALSGSHGLPSGGSILIEQTAALTAIDVNSGPAGAGRDAQRLRLETNLEAATEIARQLRFQNIGGLVVIDFIGMGDKDDEARLLAQFDGALIKDEAHPSRTSLSQFGLMEVNRRRHGASLGEMLGRRPAREQSLETIAYALLRRALRIGLAPGAGELVIVAPRPVIHWLEANRTLIENLQDRIHRPIDLVHGVVGEAVDVYLN